MKTKKTHRFTHRDPEKSVPEKISKNSPTAVNNTADVPDFVYRDLKRTGIIISSFIFSLVILYVIQMKTDWLSPLLKKFGI